MVAARTRRANQQDRIIVHAPLDLFDGLSIRDVEPTASQHHRRSGGIGTPTSGGGYTSRHLRRVEKLDRGGYDRQVGQLAQGGGVGPPERVERCGAGSNGRKAPQSDLGLSGPYDIGPERAASRELLKIDDTPECYRRPPPPSPHWRKINPLPELLDRHSPDIRQSHPSYLIAPSSERSVAREGVSGPENDRYASDDDRVHVGGYLGINDRFKDGNWQGSYKRHDGNAYGRADHIDQGLGSRCQQDRRYATSRPFFSSRKERTDDRQERPESDFERQEYIHDGGCIGSTRACGEGGERVYSPNRYDSRIHDSVDSGNYRERSEGRGRGYRSTKKMVFSRTDGYLEHQEPPSPPLNGAQRRLSSSSGDVLNNGRKDAVRRGNPTIAERQGHSAPNRGVPPAESERRPEYEANQRPDPCERNDALVKRPSDMLLFSKKARQVEYTPCTLKEYRETKPRAYVELGKLQPDLQTDELVAKRANAERVREFSANLRQINCDTAAARRRSNQHAVPKKPPANSSRTRALEFARCIPLPRKRRPQKVEQKDGEGHELVGGAGGAGGMAGPTVGQSRAGGCKPSWELSELEALEALHDDMREKVQASRSTFGVN